MCSSDKLNSFRKITQKHIIIRNVHFSDDTSCLFTPESSPKKETSCPQSFAVQPGMAVVRSENCAATGGLVEMLVPSGPEGVTFEGPDGA